MNLFCKLIKCKELNKEGYNTNFSQSVTHGLALRKKVNNVNNLHLNSNTCNRKVSNFNFNSNENIVVTKFTVNQSEDVDEKKKESVFTNFINTIIFDQVKNKPNNEIQMKKYLKSSQISDNYIDGDDEINEKNILMIDNSTNKNNNRDLLVIDNDSKINCNLILSSKK